MILTDRAKEDFKEWLFETYYYQDLSVLYPLHLSNAFIIEWFDSVGIIIEVSYSYLLGDKFYCLVSSNKNYTNIPYFDSRQEATKQAIIKANQIYNESKN